MRRWAFESKVRAISLYFPVFRDGPRQAKTTRHRANGDGGGNKGVLQARSRDQRRAVRLRVRRRLGNVGVISQVTGTRVLSRKCVADRESPELMSAPGRECPLRSPPFGLLARLARFHHPALSGCVPIKPVHYRGTDLVTRKPPHAPQGQQRPDASGREECETRTSCRWSGVASVGEGNGRAVLGVSLHAQRQV